MNSLSHHPKPLICLAPMDGYTDTAYRRIVRKINPGVILFSEFTSINGIEHSDLVRQRLNYTAEELPYIIQLFGNDPALFTKTVEQYQNTGITGIDINMGCPAKKIVQSDSGGSLIRHKDLACRIVEACCKGSEIPVSVKTRLGWENHENLIDFVQALVNAGAQMITVHGRTYRQRFKGTADWNPIYELKRAVTIPVVGNGDIKNKDEGLLQLKNLDGYMIGRATVGNPWAFWSKEDQKSVPIKVKAQTMMLHLQLIREYKEERRTLIEFRKHVSGYIKGFEGAKEIRSQLMKCETEKHFYSIVSSLI
jgi:tRNA-dihydrouridine synthase B